MKKTMITIIAVVLVAVMAVGCTQAAISEVVPEVTEAVETPAIETPAPTVAATEEPALTPQEQVIIDGYKAIAKGDVKAYQKLVIGATNEQVQEIVDNFKSFNIDDIEVLTMEPVSVYENYELYYITYNVIYKNGASEEVNEWAVLTFNNDKYYIFYGESLPSEVRNNFAPAVADYNEQHGLTQNNELDNSQRMRDFANDLLEGVSPVQADSSESTETKKPAATSGNSSSGTGSSTGNSGSGGIGSTGGNNGGSATAPTPAPTVDPNAGKTWHEPEYSQKWVIDIPASSREQSICVGCGAIITGSEESHAYNHLLNGENSQWRSEVITTPEQGHWETVMVKPGGYY